MTSIGQNTGTSVNLKHVASSDKLTARVAECLKHQNTQSQYWKETIMI